MVKGGEDHVATRLLPNLKVRHAHAGTCLRRRYMRRQACLVSASATGHVTGELLLLVSGELLLLVSGFILIHRLLFHLACPLNFPHYSLCHPPFLQPLNIDHSFQLRPS